MAIEQINLGTEPLGTGGDTARTAFEKVNANFLELQASFDSLPATFVTSWAGRDGDITPVAADISDASGVGLDLITAADEAAARTVIGLGNVENFPIASEQQAVTGEGDAYMTPGLTQLAIDDKLDNQLVPEVERFNDALGFFLDDNIPAPTLSILFGADHPLPPLVNFARPAAADRINQIGATETVPADVPRITYDADTVECRGLIVDPDLSETAEIPTDSNWYREDQGTLLIEAEGVPGRPLATLGGRTIIAGSAERKSYVMTYDSNLPASGIELGAGVFREVMYFARKLLAEEIGKLAGHDFADSPVSLFSNGETGGSIAADDLTALFQDDAGNTPAALPGDPVGLVLDQSGNGADASQSVSAARPVLARMPVTGVRNRITQVFGTNRRTDQFGAWGKTGSPIVTDGLTVDGEVASKLSVGVGQTTARIYLACQDVYEVWSVEVKAAERNGFLINRNNVTSSNLYGLVDLRDGTIVYGGGDGRVRVEPVGNGWYRVSLAIAPSTQSMAFCVSDPDAATPLGALSNIPVGDGIEGIYLRKPQYETRADLEDISPSPWQEALSPYDITEAGVPSVYSLAFDGVDDQLDLTLPAITGGTVVLAGVNGIWIEDDWSFAGGSLSIGPTTVAGLPAGILPIVGNLIGVTVIDRALTQAEREGLVRYYKGKGSKGLFVLGPELVTNGDFSDGLEGWSHSDGVTLEDGAARIHSASGEYQSFSQAGAVAGAGTYLLGFEIVSVVTGAIRPLIAGANPFPSGIWAVGRKLLMVEASASGSLAFARHNSHEENDVSVDNISLRKLELQP